MISVPTTAVTPPGPKTSFRWYGDASHLKSRITSEQMIVPPTQAIETMDATRIQNFLSVKIDGIAKSPGGEIMVVSSLESREPLEK